MKLPEPWFDPPEKRPGIFGMVPWMFWVLLGAVLLFLFGPLIAMAFHK